jgi:hypothetical protein
MFQGLRICRIPHLQPSSFFSTPVFSLRNFIVECVKPGEHKRTVEDDEKAKISAVKRADGGVLTKVALKPENEIHCLIGLLLN